MPVSNQDDSLNDGPGQSRRTELTSDFDGFHSKGIGALTAWNSIDSRSLPLTKKTHDSQHSRPSVNFPNKPDLEEPRSPSTTEKRPFHRWMRSIHRRANQRPTVLNKEAEHPSWRLQDLKEQDRAAISHRNRHHKSLSGSSFGFVSAVRSTSVSAVSQSRRSIVFSHVRSRTDHSSRASASVPRISEDSVMLERTAALDAAMLQRSLQRRRILEELISTEESYIGDIRFLMNVSFSLLQVPSSFQLNGLSALCHDSSIPSKSCRVPTIFDKSEPQRHG